MGRTAGIDLAHHIQVQPFPAQLALLHTFPIAREALIALPGAPGIGRPLFRLLVVVEQFTLVVRIDRPLHLHPSRFFQRCQQHPQLVLHAVEPRHIAVLAIGRVNPKPAPDVAALLQTVKHDHAIDQIAVNQRRHQLASSSFIDFITLLRLLG